MKGLFFKHRVNSSRVHLERFNRAFAATVPAGALVLDAAAGAQPYRRFFDHARYESADFQKVESKTYGDTTYVCDLRSIPVEDDRFDFVLFNQALEHMPEPQAVLSELCRVLKPGGRMICTAPFYYEEHEKPYDFFRYTQFAYHHLFPKAGLTVENLEWMEGYLGTVGYQLDLAARNLPRTIGMIIPRILFAMLSLLFHRMDIRKPYKDRGHPKNYVVHARKELGCDDAALPM
ncbi:MAG TPA: methyltransferase domain-containing protein [Allosphingosinicella sp.]|nr:methyltransferase domain-containing protein [Allosphingosinicella sp.]